jgi:hypothetical protein
LWMIICEEFSTKPSLSRCLNRSREILCRCVCVRNIDRWLHRKYSLL